jgi:hypothetical protein
MDVKQVLGLFAAVALILGGIFLLLYDSGGVMITWETASEVDTMGFNLYRAEGSAEVPFEQVNAELIPAKGDPLTGASYEVEDKEAKPGRLYFYQIEEVESDNTYTRYPQVVQVRSGMARQWLIAEGAALILVGCVLLYFQVMRKK